MCSQDILKEEVFQNINEFIGKFNPFLRLNFSIPTMCKNTVKFGIIYFLKDFSRKEKAINSYAEYSR